MSLSVSLRIMSGASIPKRVERIAPSLLSARVTNAHRRVALDAHSSGGCTQVENLSIVNVPLTVASGHHALNNVGDAWMLVTEPVRNMQSTVLPPASHCVAPLQTWTAQKTQ